ncbi:MAG: Terminase-like family protein [Candidatus Omnitrophota bacterium]|jgi:hypothetical protein
MAFWTPQPGPQAYAAICPADFPFFGGSRGGGKSDCLWGRHVAGAEKWGNKWNGIIVRRKYKEFAELRRRIDGMIGEGLPATRIGGDQQTNYIRFRGGAQVIMPAIQSLSMVMDHVGQQYTEISIDECTTFPFFTQMVEKLKGSNRSPYGVPCHMFGTGNPGGPGHNQVKEYFKLGKTFGVKPGTVITDSEGQTRVYIPSFLDDNRILCDNDPKYVNKLKSISDPVLRAAWLNGDWDVYIGQAFLLTDAHIIQPIPVPKHAWVYMTFDWGYGKPFSIGWWWADEEGRIYRFSEWYGGSGMPDEGLRMTDTEIAKEINRREKDIGISGRQNLIRLAGPDCWNKKPDYKGGGQGPSTAETFARFGIFLTRGDPGRKQKIQQFRERLFVPRNESGAQIDRPMMQIYNTCKDFLRTIPALSMDDTFEDVDTEQEDHVYDEACHICMARPIKLRLPESQITQAQAHIAMTERVVHDTYEAQAIANEKENNAFFEYEANQDYYEGTEGRTFSDIDGH